MEAGQPLPLLFCWVRHPSRIDSAAEKGSIGAHSARYVPGDTSG